METVAQPIEPGTRLTTEITTHETPQGTASTQVVEHRTVQVGHVGFFEEAEGVYSSIRLMAFLSLMASFVFGVLAVLGIGAGAGMTLSITFLGAAFGGKLVQKTLEGKGPLKE